MWEDPLQKIAKRFQGVSVDSFPYASRVICGPTVGADGGDEVVASKHGTVVIDMVVLDVCTPP